MRAPRPAWLLAALLLATPARAADEPKALAVPSKTEVSVGEPFTVEVRATGPAGATFTFTPEIAQEAFELSTPADSASPPPAGTHRYRAAAFALSDAMVPAIPVRYRLADGTEGEVSTTPVPLTIVSLLPKTQSEQKLADVRGPVKVAVGRAFWIGIIVLALLAAALAVWLTRRRRGTAPLVTAPIPTLEPDLDARRALDALVASGRLARGEYRPFYIELTLIAKRYLERRLGAPIVEMTTAEMLAHLRTTPVGVTLAPTLRDLAGAADQIKFARGSGLTEEAERHLAATRSLIDTVEAQLRPAAPEGGQAA